MAFFNLVCQKENSTTTAETVLETSRDKFIFEICTEGPKAVRLKNNADKLRGTDNAQITVVSELPTFTPTTIATDYLACSSTLTVCRLLHYMIESSDAGASEHATETVFQINHARILEMKAGEKCTTKNGDRLFPTARHGFNGDGSNQDAGESGSRAGRSK